MASLWSGRLPSLPVSQMWAGEVWEGSQRMDARPEEHHPRGEAVHEDAQQQRRGIAARPIADDAYHPWSEGKGELIEGDDATDHCSEIFLWEFVVDDER